MRFVGRVLAVLVVFFLAAPVASAQSELVIVKKGEKVYHRAACPAVKGAKDVVALSQAQATARGLTQHERCDPSNAPAGKSKEPESTIVYVDSSKYYHRKDCKKLEKDAKEAELEEAGKKLWPCPTCRPPIRKRRGPG